MGVAAQYGASLVAGGVSIQKSAVRTGDAALGVEVSLPAGKAGTLTTRTDNDTGVVTTTAVHGLLVNDKIDLHWVDAGVNYVRYGMTVTAVGTTTTATIDLGAGTNLPLAASAVVITKQVTVTASIDGDAASIFGVSAESTNANSTASCHLDFVDSTPTTVYQTNLAANVPLIVDVTGGNTNLLTGNPIARVNASNGSSTETMTLKLIAVTDATP